MNIHSSLPVIRHFGTTAAGGAVRDNRQAATQTGETTGTGDPQISDGVITQADRTSLQGNRLERIDLRALRVEGETLTGKRALEAYRSTAAITDTQSQQTLAGLDLTV